jgi:molybdopterin-guanine dinucleotide biosynthesis protein A
MNKKLLGVIVCGGESKRMGSDKGMLDIKGKTWVEHAVENLMVCNIQVIISINNQQAEGYSKIFSRNSMVIDDMNIGGPMNGLLSVHKRFSDQDILLVACDMIDMEESVLQTLRETYKSIHDVDFYAYEVEGVVQPFYAIYTAAALAELLRKHEEGTLGSSSLRYTLEHGNTLRIPTDANLAFTNYNTLDERKS